MILYQIIFPNGKIYMGVTDNVVARRKGHRDAALRGSTDPIHKAIRKYGRDNFELKPLVVGPTDYILDLEARAIEAFGLRNRTLGYNIRFGGRASPMKNPEIAAKVAAKNRGRKLSEERRARMIASALGRRCSDEAIANMRAAQRLRRETTVVSPETGAKIRAARLGNKAPSGFRCAARESSRRSEGQAAVGRDKSKTMHRASGSLGAR
jgi:hypothetical protein